MCSQVLEGLKMVFIPKRNANVVINIIFECINLSVQDLFLGELLQAMISLARD
jgi:hypothetical protein